MDRIKQIKQIAEQSQKRTFPYSFKAFDLDLLVYEGVFPPDPYLSWRWTVTNFPSVIEEDVLEIGCGLGLPALYLAKNGATRVVAVDIDPAAVRNAQDNAERNGLTNMEFFKSDIFSEVRHDEKFDTIYWNTPYEYVSSDYKYETQLEQGIFHPGYRMLQRYLKEAPNYLKTGGRILLGFGDSGRTDLLEKEIDASNLSSTLLARGKAVPYGETTYELYELKQQAVRS